MTTTNRQMARSPWNRRGFGLTELVVVLAMMGIMAAVAAPSLLNYWRTSSLSAGASELAAVLNRGRQLAITRNTNVCVSITAMTVQLRLASCGGTVWMGPGTDTAGAIRLANDLQIGGAANAVFTNVGGASTVATYTVTDPKTGRSRNVVVLASGRVTIQ